MQMTKNLSPQIQNKEKFKYMKQKRILILGAGEAQENLVKASKELGYFTIVCDKRTNRPAEKMADLYYRKDYMDRDAILKIARDEHIDGVISNSEPAMINVSFLVDQLGLPGNSMESIRHLLSKNSFRKLQQECGVFTPVSFETKDIEIALSRVKEFDYPIIVKPSESSGSRGATRIDSFNEKEIRKAFAACKEFSRNDFVTIEEFVQMESLDAYNADVFVVNGNILWDGWYGGKRSMQLPMVPMTKVLPPIISAESKEKIEQEVTSVLKASGVSLGEFNVETYITDKKDVFIIEINPRQAGDDIPTLIYEHTGIDLTKLLVSLTVDDDTYYNMIKSKNRDNNFITLQVVFPHNSGTYSGLFIHKDLKPYVKWVREFASIGEHIGKAQNAEDSVAYVDLRFDTRENQVKFTNDIEEYVYPIIV